MDLYKSKSPLFSKINSTLSNLTKKDVANNKKDISLKSENSNDTIYDDNADENSNNNNEDIKKEIEKINNNEKLHQNDTNKIENYIPHSKVGSGRVTMYREFGIMHAYTIEANYYCSKEIHEITTSEDVSCSSPIPLSKNTYIKPYSINTMMSMGHGILTSILEMNYNFINTEYNDSK